MQYCYVQNGQIVEGPKTLPKNWKNISALNKMSDEMLISNGWFPVAEEIVGEGVMEKSTTTLIVESNRVTKRIQLANYTEEDIALINSDKWDSVRVTRDELLRECDWTQMADVTLSDATKLNWLTYRQALRDITKQSSPDSISWPQAPGKGIGVAIL
jgi:hypothetical protein